MAALGTQAADRSAASAGQRLFGRDEVFARLRLALQRPGCVTLVGPSGVGKTALAQALRSDWIRAQPDMDPDGFRAPPAIDLSVVMDAGMLVPALCQGCGVEATPGDADHALVHALGGGPKLVVIDSAEHLVEAVACLASSLMSQAPALRLLVTSQVSLAIAGESVERIDCLALPSDEAVDEEELQASAITLFGDRVLSADSYYRFGGDAGPIVRAICAELDGLPLAIEMAAAQVPRLGLEGVRDALNDRFALLRHRSGHEPARHRTLQATLDRTYDLLTPAARRVFRALGVFRQGFTIDLAVSVVCDRSDERWDTIDVIANIVAHSMVESDHGNPPRYSLLRSVRSYASARLAESGDEAHFRARHAVALCDLLHRANEASEDPAGRALRRLGLDEKDNVDAALEWARRSAPSVALKLDAEATLLFDLAAR